MLITACDSRRLPRFAHREARNAQIPSNVYHNAVSTIGSSTRGEIGRRELGHRLFCREPSFKGILYIAYESTVRSCVDARDRTTAILLFILPRAAFHVLTASTSSMKRVAQGLFLALASVLCRKRRNNYSYFKDSSQLETTPLLCPALFLAFHFLPDTTLNAFVYLLFQLSHCSLACLPQVRYKCLTPSIPNKSTTLMFQMKTSALSPLIPPLCRKFCERGLSHMSPHGS